MQIRISTQFVINILAVVLIAPAASADELTSTAPAPGVQVEQSLKTEHGTIPYLLCLPKDYETQDRVPLLLFLHGRGESNGPLRLVEQWGPPKMAASGDAMPYIVVSPQCPRESRWTDDDQQKMILALLDYVSQQFKVDESRVYLTGLSMGGFGSWRLAADHPTRFAAAAIICGRGEPERASDLVSVPIWVFHGDQDKAVPFSDSVEMVDAIRKAGGEKIRFTTLEHVGHNSWSAAYATPELYEWMNQHTRQIEQP